VRAVPLAHALLELQRRSGVSLAFSPSLVAAAKEVSCPCREATVREALERLLLGTPFGYAQADGQVLVERRRAPALTLRKEAPGTAAPSRVVLPERAATVDSAAQLAALDEPVDWSSLLRNATGTVRGRALEAGSGRPLASSPGRPAARSPTTRAAT
jgi:hypothetical protein